MPITPQPSPAQTIANGLREVAEAIRESRTPLDIDPVIGYAPAATFTSHTGRLVSGGPVPKAGEISEAAIDREACCALGAHIAEIKDWIAEHDATPARPWIDNAKYGPVDLPKPAAPLMPASFVMPIMEGDGAAPTREALREARALLDRRSIALDQAHATIERLTAERDSVWATHHAALDIAVRQARIEQIEDCARAAEAAEDPVEVYRLHDGRITILDNCCGCQIRLCSAAIRALDLTRKETPQ